MTKTAILILILLIVAAGIYTEMQRGNNLSATARKLGLEFRSGLQPVPADLQAAEFDLLQQGGSEIGNLMHGRHDGLPMQLFDYHYDATAAGEGFGAQPATDDQTNIERRGQTVLYLQLPAPLPDFDLSPMRSHMRQVARRSGLSPLSLDDSAFRHQYQLLARDSQRVRSLFDDSLRGWLLQHPGLMVEARGRDLLIYRSEQRLKAKEIPAFLQELSPLVNLLREVQSV